MSSYHSLFIGIILISASIYWLNTSYQDLRNSFKQRGDRTMNISMIIVDEILFEVRLRAPIIILFVGVVFLLSSFGLI